MKRLTIISMFLAASLAPAATITTPAILTPGSTVSSLPDFEDFGDFLGTLSTSFGTGQSSPSGTFLETVITNTADNPFGNQDLTFAFAFRVTAGDVVEISLSGFRGWFTAVKECTVCNGGTPALDATRSADGDVVSFDFTGIEANGNSTASLAIYTNAPSFTDPMITYTDVSGSTALSNGLLPAAPEPGSLGLVLVGSLVASALWMRRKAASGS
jgi:hypothetical protein